MTIRSWNPDSKLVTLNLVSCFLVITVKLTVRRKRLVTTITKAWLFPIRTPWFDCYGNIIDVIVKSSCVTLTDFHVLNSKCHTLNIPNIRNDFEKIRHVEKCVCKREESASAHWIICMNEPVLHKITSDSFFPNPLSHFLYLYHFNFSESLFSEFPQTILQ